MGGPTTLLRLLAPIVILEAVVGIVFLVECLYRLATADVHWVELVAEGRLALTQMTVLAALAGAAVSGTAALLQWSGRQGAAAPPRAATGLAAFVVGMAVLAWALPVRQSVAEAPDVLLIVLDTVRADAVDAGRTPHLHRLGAEGIRFTDSYSVAPWTLPTFGTILTGRHPRDHRAGMVGDSSSAAGPMRGDVRTLAEAFSEAGYRTVSVTTNPHLRAENGVGRGFDSHRNLMLDNALFATSFPVTRSTRFASGTMQATRAETWFALRDRGKPLFMLLHVMDAHTPRDPPAGHVEKEIASGSEPGEAAVYGAAVREVDDAIGRLIGELEAAGQLDRTIVAVISDHGEGLEPAGERNGHGGSLFPELTRAILTVRLPRRLGAGTECREVTSLIDLAETVLSLADLPGAMGSGRALLTPEGRCVAGSGVAFVGATTVGPDRDGLVTSDLSIIVTRPDGVEAFDPRADPDYRTPLPGEARSNAWYTVLESHVADQRGRAEGLSLPGPTEIGPELREQLEALGYTE